MLIELEGLRCGGRDNDLIITDYTPPDHSVEASDLTIPGRAGLYAGRDRRTERSHVFTIRTSKASTLAEAQALADELTAVWRAAADLPHGQTQTLVIETTRRRRIFGRLRKLTPLTPDVRAQQGSIELLAEFLQTDPTVYGEFDTEFSLSVLPESQGGILTPISTPISTRMWGGVNYRFVTNEGSSPSQAAVTFYGPCSNPALTVNGKTVALKGTLKYDQSITVDGRTSQVTRNDGANVSHMLTSRTRLDNLTIAPGRHEVGFTAEDTTMTARADISFAAAYDSI